MKWSFRWFFSSFLLVTRALCALHPTELEKLKGEDGLIRLTDANFDRITSGARDYYLAILFTASSPEINCDVCKKFEPVYAKVARSYEASNPGKNAVFFLIADFPQNQKKFGELQMTQVPRTWLLPPSKEASANILSPHLPYKIGDKALADPLDYAGFISKLVNVNIIVQEEFDLVQFLQYFGGTFALVFVLKKKVLAKAAKGAVFRMLSVFSICVLTGGYMFTLIRGIPLIAKDNKGEIMYFSGGTHWQFGLETFIIAAFYMLFTILMSGLCVKIPAIEDPKRRSAATIFASFAIFWLFNTLTKVYLVKDPGYPYTLTNYF